ncbi:nuclear transport factor 2 family protein [Phenylobacterium sp. LjRoot225]|uniref:nuclear transport factor 2 family protein n=1 Tax=Phenylobacterium sp. LjRoot225 TaxID=3342285 RepID=UPI003ECD5E5B
MRGDHADVQELIDRQRIWECLLRYTRGMDRLDRDLVLSAYHSGGMEDHGVFIAPFEVFTDQALGFHRDAEVRTQHIMNNHWCEIDGDVAHAETYVACYAVTSAGKESYSLGRFIDRLEKRGGRWGIVDRVCVREGSTDLPSNGALENFAPEPRSFARPTRDRNDPSYLRPLKVWQA